MTEPRVGPAAGDSTDAFITLVVSTYRRPRALELVLASVGRQSYRDFSVVVADDGSGPETRAVVERFADDASVPVSHVWQEDEGYRLAAVRNRAVASAGGAYLVFIDGDCLIRPNFLARHAGLAAPGRFVFGSRIRIGPELTGAIEASGVRAAEWTRSRWLTERARGRIDRFSPLLTLPLGPLRDLRPDAWTGPKGCNLAIWRRDYVAVNGIDEGFSGWGFEDNDLVLRLVRAGVRRRAGRYAVPVLHLWHEQRPLVARNRARFEARFGESTTRAEIGIDRYL